MDGQQSLLHEVVAVEEQDGEVQCNWWGRWVVVEDGEEPGLHNPVSPQG